MPGRTNIQDGTQFQVLFSTLVLDIDTMHRRRGRQKNMSLAQRSWASIRPLSDIVSKTIDCPGPSHLARPQRELSRGQSSAVPELGAVNGGGGGTTSGSFSIINPHSYRFITLLRVPKIPTIPPALTDTAGSENQSEKTKIRVKMHRTATQD